MPNNIKYGYNLEMSEDKKERLENVYYSMKELYDVRNTEIFNSGYEGIVFYVNDIKVYVIEQPGVLGLENQNPGYLELRINGETIHKFRHVDRRFGDVDLTEKELEEYYYKILETLHEL